jgi:hypothetical protein
MLSIVSVPFGFCQDTPSSSIVPSLSMPSPPLSLDGNTSILPGQSNRLFSQPPTLSSRYTLQGTTLMPYIGLGFNGGNLRDSSGTLIPQSGLAGSLQDDRLLRDGLGRTAMPNEFQLGIRIPF